MLLVLDELHYVDGEELLCMTKESSVGVNKSKNKVLAQISSTFKLDEERRSELEQVGFDDFFIIFCVKSEMVLDM